MRKTWVTILVIIIIIIIGWWIWSASNKSGSYQTYAPTTSDQTQSAAPMIPATSTPATAVVDISTSTSLGSFLVATNGMTLYTYSPDKPNQSVCTGGCATAWPPYAVTGPLTGGDNVTGALSTYTRADGSTQLTYNGKPLYFYAKDMAPGDIKGQGVGGVWYVAKP